MEANTVTLIVGLSGIGATLIASSLGIYFTAKARSSALRETLFNKQLDIIARIIHKQERFRVFAIVLAKGNDNTYKDKVREEIGECTKDFSEIQEESAAILPTELLLEVKKLNDHMIEILISYDEGSGIHKDSFKTLYAMMAKIVLLSRVSIGVDELTKESLSLFSGKRHYENVANIEIEYFRKLHEEANSETD